MAATSLSELLNLPPGERADLAVALWESLSDEQREAGLPLGPNMRLNSTGVGRRM